MILYKPVFSTMGWSVESFNSKDVRILGRKKSDPAENKICRWKPRAGYYGPIYDCNNIFTTAEDAWRWINKDYSVTSRIFTDFKEIDI